MTEFFSVFKKELHDFLSARQGTVGPDTFKNDCRILGSFDKYLYESGFAERYIPEYIITGWTQTLYETNSPKTIADKLGYLRNFLKYLQYCGIQVFIPVNPKIADAYVPYLFSDDEIERIFHTADTLTHGRSTTRLQIPMILRMLYGCGFRIGELLNIRVCDVNFKKHTVLVKHAKNKKQRIAVMSSSLSSMLERYCAAMLLKADSSYLFPSEKTNKPLSKSTVSMHFRNILKCTGIYTEPLPHKRGQCIHCLRHNFAVRSFAQAEKYGKPAVEAVPYLSVYLGHYDMNGTEKYLKFSPDMFPEYMDMFEAYTGSVFAEVSYEE